MLEQEFHRIKADHRQALVKRATSVVLEGSVLRVYRAGTKKQLIPILNAIPYDEIPLLQNQEDFRQWFEYHLDILAEEIHKKNADNHKINPGYKWGHATKILTLQVREIVLNSRYFSDETVQRISPWLYVPIDSVVIKRLKQVGVRPKFSRINQIDSAENFYFVQEALETAAHIIGVPRVWFDDVWGDRQ
jgi:hypothetical protein